MTVVGIEEFINQKIEAYEYENRGSGPDINPRLIENIAMAAVLYAESGNKAVPNIIINGQDLPRWALNRVEQTRATYLRCIPNTVNPAIWLEHPDLWYPYILWAAQIAADETELQALRRQRDDLLATNNAYLQRARDAEDRLKALDGFDADYMTSEQHHPDYVLIPTEVFDRVRAAANQVTTASETPDERCLLCGGTGTLYDEIPNTYRECWSCDGTGNA
ncbi:hypothetical protein AEAC466_04385 [Asticcacaulis sp. AC466]|uniref:hypothetical protein n=1 Tax=Asticcacaulis sp. AC466 TaxID=1282362 RepID=UPI0003C40452|nr:hypothetical protein [Asticcacaulis sp. AC466]ESQ85408.1 hypothetical protein AEAC466_04385 [Asticcacaulis sp. AC466]